jgi:hypothetical protein
LARYIATSAFFISVSTSFAILGKDADADACADKELLLDRDRRILQDGEDLFGDMRDGAVGRGCPR